MGYYQYTGTLGIGERLYTSIASGRLTDLTENITIMWRDYNVHMDGTTPWVNFPFNGQSAWIPKERIGNQAQTWVETQSKATAPTAVSVAANLAEGTVKLSWSGAAGGTENSITGYNIQYSEYVNSAFTGWKYLTAVNSTATSGSATVAVNPTRGGVRGYRVQTKGSAGAEWFSDYSKNSPLVATNRLTTIKSIDVVGKTYCNRPLIRATINADPDAKHSANAFVSIDGGAEQNAGWIAATGGPVRFRWPTALSVGTHGVKLIIRDALGGEVSQSFNISVAKVSWKRTISSGTVISGGGISHISDIEEMLAAVNVQRAYYKIGAMTLPGTVGKFADWKAQMDAMSLGLDSCKLEAGEAYKTRIVASRNYPRADIVNWLRAYIEEV